MGRLAAQEQACSVFLASAGSQPPKGMAREKGKRDHKMHKASLLCCSWRQLIEGQPEEPNGRRQK